MGDTEESPARGETPIGVRSLLITLVVILLVVALFQLSHVNYLLFHSLVEFASITVSATLFSIGWNARHFTRNDSFTFLAISFSPIVWLELFHTLSYHGMGIFPHISSDIPTQLWIALRTLEAVSFLLAALLVGRRLPIRPYPLLLCWGTLGAVLGLSIWPLGIFPHCLVEETGLTRFKVVSEYVICLILAGSGVIFWLRREHLSRLLCRLLLIAIGLGITAELSFTLYRDVYGITNVLGHILNLASSVLVYRALVLGSLRTPYQTLFRDLAQSHQELDRELIQRKQTEDELRTANAELDTFVRAISHDLRTPLTMVIGGAQLLQTDLKNAIGQGHRSLLEGIEQQGKTMANMLEDLLSLASIGHIEQAPEPVSSRWLTERVLNSLGATASSRVRVGTMPTLVAHESLIYQLLLNLIGNALRYGGEENGPIEIGGERTGNRVQLHVRDHGPGIPEEEREKVFTPFHRLEVSREKPGTGIGLATVRKIVEYYQGQIRIEETPGGGATFRVELVDAC